MNQILKNNWVLPLIIVLACNQETTMNGFDFKTARVAFQDTLDGQAVDLYLLENSNGAKVAITNYGGRIVSLMVPDLEGELRDVVLGYNSLEGYLGSNEVYFGALIGRYGNRIAKGQFVLDSIEYTLAKNNGPNNLHGGPGGFHNVVWEVKSNSPESLTLTYLSADGEEGFPGNLQVEMTYSLNDENELKMSYQASSDKKTVINLTNHAFFNLNGDGSGTINGHELQIAASQFTPVDSTLIPLGGHAEVEDSPFDFREATPIGARVDQQVEQLVFGKGYDHNFVLDKGQTANQEWVATIFSPQSGIEMRVLTTEPGLQFYGGNFLDGSDQGKNGKYVYRSAFCLETQHFPDSPNQPDFPTTVLEPGVSYQTESTYKFGIR